jgi:hypothetical protein
VDPVPDPLLLSTVCDYIRTHCSIKHSHIKHGISCRLVAVTHTIIMQRRVLIPGFCSLIMTTGAKVDYRRPAADFFFFSFFL